MRTITATLLSLTLLISAGPAAGAGQEEQFTPEFKEVRSSYDAKHTPKLTAPSSVKRGQWFDVTVLVGAGGDHPSLAEHHVRYIALYKDTAEIARVYLHPVFSAPKVTFTIALDEGGMLRALAEPTHSAAWEVSKKITVSP
jgi:superoxide reductase